LARLEALENKAAIKRGDRLLTSNPLRYRVVVDGQDITVISGSQQEAELRARSALAEFPPEVIW